VSPARDAPRRASRCSNRSRARGNRDDGETDWKASRTERGRRWNADSGSQRAPRHCPPHLNTHPASPAGEVTSDIDGGRKKRREYPLRGLACQKKTRQSGSSDLFLDATRVPRPGEELRLQKREDPAASPLTGSPRVQKGGADRSRVQSRCHEAPREEGRIFGPRAPRAAIVTFISCRCGTGS